MYDFHKLILRVCIGGRDIFIPKPRLSGKCPFASIFPKTEGNVIAWKGFRIMDSPHVHFILVHIYFCYMLVPLL